jgi:hypothetical protein
MQISAYTNLEVSFVGCGSFYFLLCFMLIRMVFLFLWFGCIHRRLYTVGPSSPERAQLNMSRAGFLL